MCLYSVTKRFNCSNQSMIGYKVLIKNEKGELNFPHFEDTNHPLEVDVTYQANELTPNIFDSKVYMLSTSDGNNYYPNGFHCFETFEAAQYYAKLINDPVVIVRVILYEVHTAGLQSANIKYLPTLVSNRMRIDKDWDIENQCEMVYKVQSL